MGFPSSSAGKESTCSERDPSWITGSRRSTGEGIGSPLQYSWASLVAQLVKNLPAMWETWVWSLHWEDPLEKGMAMHSSILAWTIPLTIQSMGSQWVRHNWVTFIFKDIYAGAKIIKATRKLLIWNTKKRKEIWDNDYFSRWWKEMWSKGKWPMSYQ